MNPFMKTLKKIAAAYNGVSLILRIAIGLVVGVILALVCPGATWLKELGNLFVGALKGIAPVLVFVIVGERAGAGLDPSSTAASARSCGSTCLRRSSPRR